MRIKYLAVALVLFSSTASAYEVSSKLKDVMFGLRAGYLASGTAEVEGIAADTDASMTYGIFLDYRAAEKLYTTFHFNMHNIAAYGYDENMMDIGGAFKLIVPTSNEKITIRPGVNMGYGRLPEIPLGIFTVKSSTYFLIGPSVDLLINTNSSANILAEIGFISAPSGGNSQFEVNLNPTFYLRGGITF
ncbi:hypothetical protein ACFL6Y_03865 [Elusimicrobiota bacterium]